VVCFVGAQVALTLAMERWLPQMRDQEWHSKLVRLRRRLAKEPRPALVVMQGSSRTLFGFAADRFSGRRGPGGAPVVAFNFGLAGAGPLREWLCLRQLLQEGIRPDLLLVEVLPVLLNAPGPGRQCEENWLYVPHLAGMDIALLKPYCSRPGRLAKAWLRSRLLPCCTNRQGIVRALAPRWLPPEPPSNVLARMDRWGWVPVTWGPVSAETRRSSTEATRRHYAPAFQDFRIGSGPARALADCLELCRREQIRVALVLMPEGPAFRSWNTPAAEAQLQGFLAELRKKYPAGLIDARTWVGEEGFLDSHHLLPGGATVFSNRLADEVLRLWDAPPGLARGPGPHSSHSRFATSSTGAFSPR
jgi:hypothetical protein